GERGYGGERGGSSAAGVYFKKRFRGNAGTSGDLRHAPRSAGLAEQHAQAFAAGVLEVAERVSDHTVILIPVFFSSRRRHTILTCDWSSDVCSSDLRGDPVGSESSSGKDGNARSSSRRI